MRIAFVITSLETGGAEVMLSRIVSRLSPRFEPYVVSLSTIGAVGKKIREAGVTVESAGFSASVPNPLRLISLVKCLRRIRPHIVQTWLYHADLFGTIAALAAKVPTVTWNIRCTDLDPRKTPATTRLILKLLVYSSGIPSAIVVNSHTGKRVHEALGYRTKRWEIISNGVDTEEFRPRREARIFVRGEFGLKEGEVLFGMVARYHPMKDHATLIRSLAMLATERPSVHLALVGAGLTTENQRLCSSIQELGLGNRVHLFGERQDIAVTIAGLDCLIMSSAWGEGFPNVVAEAMACGVPCIVTDVGDARTIVGDTGWVVPPRSPQALAGAMRGFLDLSPAQRDSLGLNARRRVAEGYALGPVIKKYEAVFDSFGPGEG